MSAIFEIKINAIRTSELGGMVDVIRQVDFTVTGAQDGQSFALHQTAQFDDPLAEGGFIPLVSLTEANVVGFIESGFSNLDSVKAHIQFVLDKEIAKASLQSTPLPWSAAGE
jgi:hypothetical protein